MGYFKKQYLPQYLAAASASLIMFATGTTFGWISPATQKLSSPNSPIPLSPSQISWIASLGPLGSLHGPLTGAMFANWIGRKKTILLLTIPFFISWTLIAIGSDVYYFYGAQLFAGFGDSASLTVIPMYLSEIATPNIRGALGMLIMISMHLGILFEYVTVPYMTIESNAFLSMLIPVSLLATFSWMPESPYFLQMKNKTNDANIALRKLRNYKNETDMEKEKTLVTKTIANQQNEEGKFVDLLRIDSNRKAMVIMIGTMVAQQLSGIKAIASYGHLILQESKSELSPAISGIIVEILSLMFAVLFAILIDSKGRKKVLLISCLLIIIPLTTLGIFFYLQHIEYPYISRINILPMISLCMYKICFLIGLGSIPHILIGEIFPTNVSVLASCIAGMLCAVMGFLTPKMYQKIEELFGLYVVFWIFAGFCFLGFIFVWFFVPETKRKSLFEIQQMMCREI